MFIVIPILVELALLMVLIKGLRNRARFISNYPELRRFYDYGLLGLSLVVLSKFVFMVLDLRDQGTIELTTQEMRMINLTGNALLLLAVAMILLGWVRLIGVLVERYELIPVIEFEDEGTQEQLKPGLYLCTLQNCYPVMMKLLKGRAGLIVSRHPPELVKKNLQIEKTPILWLTTLRGENTVSPTRLEFLLQTIVDFMGKTKDPKVIFLDGLEYLILENGFVPVFKFLTTLKDYTTIYNAIIIVPVSEESLDEKRLGLLHREFERLKMNHRELKA